MSGEPATSNNVVALAVAQKKMSLAFLGWQCRVRQLSARRHEGKPNPAMLPNLTLRDQAEPLGAIVTVMNKRPEFSRTKEFRHIYQKTNDPKQRRDDALKIIQEMYYQITEEFSDVLTATFAPGSMGAETMLHAGFGRLDFEEFGQTYSFPVRIARLISNDPLYQSTFWHNAMFNPSMDPNLTIIGFQPDWSTATSNP
ncbi:MAG: hypothetical protein OSB69_12525 [Alphaproteobacteria bacterium]|nr:hypothetical protein [Alphaproteobacteria bacterium]